MVKCSSLYVNYRLHHLNFCYVAGSPLFQALCHEAFTRIESAYRPKTVSAHKTHFTTFLQFCELISQQLEEISPCTIIAFIEFLAKNGLTHASVCNYLSSLKTVFKLYQLPVHILDHEWVRLTLRSIALNVPVPLKIKGLFSIQHMYQLISLCNQIPYGLVYKSLFLSAFFGFLRLSNIAPVSVKSFDVFTHLCRADFIRSSSHGHLILKWSKTLQNQNQFKVIHLPFLGSSPLCPISALQVMCSSIPASKNSPLFCAPQGLGVVPLTQSKVRKMLRALVLSMGLDPEIHSFHTFRRSGASFAYNNGIAVDSIQKQGTWTSDSVWAYLIQDPSHCSSLMSIFQHLLQR